MQFPRYQTVKNYDTFSRMKSAFHSAEPRSVFNYFHSEKFQRDRVIFHKRHTPKAFHFQATATLYACVLPLSCRFVKLNSFSVKKEAAAIAHNSRSWNLFHIFVKLCDQKKI